MRFVDKSETPTTHHPETSQPIDQQQRHPPPPTTAAHVLQLQARHGNAFVQRMLKQSAPGTVQRMRDRFGNDYPVIWSALDAEAAMGLLQKIHSGELRPDEHDVSRLMAIVNNAPRQRRAATEGVSYKGQMQSSSGFNPRYVHGKTTNYPDNPVTLATQHFQGDSQMALTYERLHRPNMSDSFTQQLIAEAQARPTTTPYEDRMISGQSLSEAGVARDHRLADSSIQAIVAISFQTLAAQPATGRSAVQLKAFQDWAQVLGNGTAYQDLLNALAARDAGKPFEGFLQEIVNKLSVNGTNVRFGDAERNERASNAADWGMTSGGGLTPLSALIKPATLNLAAVGLIPNQLAIAATTQATDKATGQPISSTFTG
jgi:hypothetical protein